MSYIFEKKKSYIPIFLASKVDGHPVSGFCLSCFVFAGTTHVSCNSLVIRKIHINDIIWKALLFKYMPIKHKYSHILDRYADMTQKHLDWVLKLWHTLLLMCSKPTKLALNCTCACSTSSRLVPWLVDVLCCNHQYFNSSEWLNLFRVSIFHGFHKHPIHDSSTQEITIFWMIYEGKCYCLEFWIQSLCH